MTQEELKILDELIASAQRTFEYCDEALKKAKLTLEALIEKRESNQ